MAVRWQAYHYHWLDEVSDFVLNEWIRDYIADENPQNDHIKNGIYKHYNATSPIHDRIRRRLDGVLAEIKKQDREPHVNNATNNATTPTEKKSDEKDDELTPSDYIKKQESITYDELTPSDYIKKQEELQNTQQYKKIRNAFLRKMSSLLKDKTQKTINEECKNENCPSINVSIENVCNCKCVQRIDVILKTYNELMKCDKLWRKVPIGPIIAYKDDKIDLKYGHQQIFNDFLHIKLFHIDPIDDDNNKKTESKQNDNNDKDNNSQNKKHESKINDSQNKKNTPKIICKYFENRYPCEDIPKCYAFARHFRDRSDFEAEKLMFHLIEAYPDKTSQKTVQMKADIDVILQEECDKIHCFFLHSTFQFSDDANAKDEKKSNEIIDVMNQYGSGRSWAQTKEQKEEQKKEEQNKEKQKHNTKKGYVGKKEDEKWLAEFHKENEEDGYKLLVKHMGIFSWQSAHGFRTGQCRGLQHLKPKFKNVKDEALLNSYNQASADNWNQTLRKSKIFYQSFARKKINTLYPGSFDDDVTDTHITWIKGEEIAMKEIVMLKLYTDFDKLQHELKKCFRWESIRPILNKIEQKTNEEQIIKDDHELEKKINVDDDAKRKELENRLREFFHWRVGLLIVLNKYGKKINEKSMVLYHGVNAKMILNPAETMAFYGPLSTTSSYHVAKTFATAKGMVLKITSQYPRLDYCRAFDASVISDYPEEQEHLIGFIYMRVLEIKTRPIVNDIHNRDMWDKAPLASKIRVVFFSIHLFRQQMFSMSEHLEYYLVEFLKCNQMDCCMKSKYNIKSATNEIKESLLSFLCCMCAKHDNKLTQDDYWKQKNDASYTQIMKILWRKFNEFRNKPNSKQVVKIDQISKKLKPFFLDKIKNRTDVHGNDVYEVSFEKLLTIFPKVEEVHYINEYRVDDNILKKLVKILNEKQNKINLKKVSFLYYNYQDPNTGQKLGHPIEGNNFYHPKGLDSKLINELDNHKWIMKADKNGRIGFKIRFYESVNKPKLTKGQ